MSAFALTHTENQIDCLSEALDELGLGISEVKVFRSLLNIGARQASTLAKHSGISRAHVYGILDKLVHKGLVSVHERGGVRHFSALPLEELSLALEEKEKSLAKQRRALSTLLLASNASQQNLWSDPQTKSFRGAEARARLFQELTRPESERSLLFCSAAQSLFFEDHSPTKDSLLQLLNLVPSGLKILLFSEDTAARMLAEQIKHPEIVALPSALPTELIVAGNRVTLVGRRAESACSITMAQPALAAGLRELGGMVTSASVSTPMKEG